MKVLFPFPFLDIDFISLSWAVRLSDFWFFKTVRKLISELPSKAQMWLGAKNENGAWGASFVSYFHAKTDILPSQAEKKEETGYKKGKSLPVILSEFIKNWVKLTLRCFLWVENSCLVEKLAGQSENHRVWMWLSTKNDSKFYTPLLPYRKWMLVTHSK